MRDFCNDEDNNLAVQATTNRIATKQLFDKLHALKDCSESIIHLDTYLKSTDRFLEIMQEALKLPEIESFLKDSVTHTFYLNKQLTLEIFEYWRELLDSVDAINWLFANMRAFSLRFNTEYLDEIIKIAGQLGGKESQKAILVNLLKQSVIYNEGDNIIQFLSSQNYCATMALNSDEILSLLQLSILCHSDSAFEIVLTHFLDNNISVLAEKDYLMILKIIVKFQRNSILEFLLKTMAKLNLASEPSDDYIKAITEALKNSIRLKENSFPLKAILGHIHDNCNNVSVFSAILRASILTVSRMNKSYYLSLLITHPLTQEAVSSMLHVDALVASIEKRAEDSITLLINLIENGNLSFTEEDIKIIFKTASGNEFRNVCEMVLNQTHEIGNLEAEFLGDQYKDLLPVSFWKHTEDNTVIIPLSQDKSKASKPLTVGQKLLIERKIDQYFNPEAKGQPITRKCLNVKFDSKTTATLKIYEYSGAKLKEKYRSEIPNGQDNFDVYDKIFSEMCAASIIEGVECTSSLNDTSATPSKLILEKVKVLSSLSNPNTTELEMSFSDKPRFANGLFKKCSPNSLSTKPISESNTAQDTFDGLAACVQRLRSINPYR